MKILLTSAIAFVLAANVSAQDVTPSQFKFKELPLGKITSYWGKGANPTIAELQTPGSIIAGVAPAQADAGNLLQEYTSSALSIVNSEFGHLLLVKGKNAPAAVTEGNASTGNLSAGWWNLIFVGPTSVVGATHRTTAQMKLITDVPYAETAVVNFSYTSGQGNAIGQRKTVYAGDTGWFQSQLQGTMGAQNPARSVIGFPGNLMDKSALYIYEISVEVNPTQEIVNTPNDEGVGMDKPNGAGTVGFDKRTGNTSFVTWDEATIYINNADSQEVAIYSISGQLVSQLLVNGNFVEIPMEKGAYVVKIGNKATKVIL